MRCAAKLKRKKYIEAHGRFIKESPQREEARRQQKWRKEDGSPTGVYLYALPCEGWGICGGGQPTQGACDTEQM